MPTLPYQLYNQEICNSFKFETGMLVKNNGKNFTAFLV